jgi:hypothetical protein
MQARGIGMMECWSVGMMEYWGRECRHYSIIPVLQYSYLPHKFLPFCAGFDS